MPSSPQSKAPHLQRANNPPGAQVLPLLAVWAVSLAALWCTVGTVQYRPALCRAWHWYGMGLYILCGAVPGASIPYSVPPPVYSIWRCTGPP